MSDSRDDLSRFDWPGEKGPRAEDPVDRGPEGRSPGAPVPEGPSGLPAVTMPDLDDLFGPEEEGPAPVREREPEGSAETVPDPAGIPSGTGAPEAGGPVPYAEQDLTDRSYIPDDIPDDGRNRRSAMAILGGMGALFLVLILLLIARLPAFIDSSFGGGSGGWGQGESLFSFLTREQPSYGGGVSVSWTEEEEDEDDDPFDPDYSYLLSRMEYSPLQDVLFPVEIYDPERGGDKDDPYRDDIEDCAARIGGTLFDFPVKWEDLTQAGFEPVSSGEEEKVLLYPGETWCQTFEKDGKQVRFQICSHARRAQLLQDCPVSGFTAEGTDSGFADIVLPCGVSLAEADRDDLKDAYGKPDSEKKDSGTMLWDSGYFGGCIIRLDGEGRVTACSYMDFSVPGGYQEPGLPEGLVWEEEEAVLPDPPAGDGSDGAFRTSTGTYCVLQPMGALLDDGWEIVYSESDCPAGQTVWINLKNQEEEELTLEVLNISPDLLPARDCRIIGVGVYDGDAFLGIGPFETGMAWEDARAASPGIGEYSSVEEDGDIYITYRNDESYDADYIFVSADDGEEINEVYFYFEATANAAMDRMRESVRLP